MSDDSSATKFCFQNNFHSLAVTFEKGGYFLLKTCNLYVKTVNDLLRRRHSVKTECPCAAPGDRVRWPWCLEVDFGATAIAREVYITKISRYHQTRARRKVTVKETNIARASENKTYTANVIFTHKPFRERP